MQKDIRNLRIKIVAIIAMVVAIILGMIFGILYKLISTGLGRMSMDPISIKLIMHSIRIRGWTAFLVGILIFTLIGILVSKWIVKPVENAWKEQKQFVSDASHELKTPLTVITTNAELLQGEDIDEADRIKFSGNILTVSRQMRHLIEDMLNLARVERGDEAGFQDFNLSDAFEKLLLQFEPVFFEKNLNLVENIDPGIIVYGSSQKLCQLLSIFLDNAAKYSKPGDVEVILCTQGRNAQLVVENPADALSEQQLKDIFKRFYRVDASRTDRESYGLGLSIAKSICEAHNGNILAEYKNDRVRFIATIPFTNHKK